MLYDMPIQKKNPAAVALGRRGGLKGGPARAASMTAEERSESARNAVTARWARVKKKKTATSKNSKSLAKTRKVL